MYKSLTQFAVSDSLAARWSLAVLWLLKKPTLWSHDYETFQLKIGQCVEAESNKVTVEEFQLTWFEKICKMPWLGSNQGSNHLLIFCRFVDSPVTCKVTDVSVKQGKSMCKWSSCREGCTSDMYQCYQVRVQYIDESYRNDSLVDDYLDREWKNLSRFDTLEVEVSLNQEYNQRGHRYDHGCN